MSCAAILAANPTSGTGSYIIDPDGVGGAVPVQTYCDMTTAGGGWTQVYDQDFAAFGNVRTTAAWIAVNTNQANQGDYSILNRLPGLGNGASYQFRYEWLDGPMPNGYLQWTQNASPLLVGDATSRATISGVSTSLGSTPSGCAAFSGLGVSQQTGNTLLDGDQGGCWWMAVGVAAPHNDGFNGIPAFATPSTGVGQSTRHARLWVRPGA